MVDFLIVACRENLILFLFLDREIGRDGSYFVTMSADLRFVERRGKLPLEVPAVLPDPGEVVGGQGGHRHGVVHQPVLLRQDLSKIDNIEALQEPCSSHLSLILFSLICSSEFEEGSVSVLTRDLSILCIFSEMADIPSCRMGRMKTLNELRLSESRDPQTSRPRRLVQTLLCRRLWVNLSRQADISGKTWSHHQLLVWSYCGVLVWACSDQH